MQERHKNRAVYFKELSVTSREHFIPYIRRWHAVEPGMRVLEIGCGDGGNLLPFAEMGCDTTGIDISVRRIEDARTFFRAAQAKGTFIAQDIFRLTNRERSFDLVLCHDVLEHIADKVRFLSVSSRLLKPGGVVFLSFPAWQMPFGGHQQICRSSVLSRLPFIHLLPATLYRLLLKTFGESDDCMKELFSIKRTGVTIGQFEKLLEQTTLGIQHRQLWLVNPHYKIKFGLSPRKLHPLVSRIPCLRNFLSTSCFYILKDTR